MFKVKSKICILCRSKTVQDLQWIQNSIFCYFFNGCTDLFPKIKVGNNQGKKHAIPCILLAQFDGNTQIRPSRLIEHQQFHQLTKIFTSIPFILPIYNEFTILIADRVQCPLVSINKKSLSSLLPPSSYHKPTTSLEQYSDDFDFDIDYKPMLPIQKRQLRLLQNNTVLEVNNSQNWLKRRRSIVHFFCYLHKFLLYNFFKLPGVKIVQASSLYLQDLPLAQRDFGKSIFALLATKLPSYIMTLFCNTVKSMSKPMIALQ